MFIKLYLTTAISSPNSIISNIEKQYPNVDIQKYLSDDWVSIFLVKYFIYHEVSIELLYPHEKKLFRKFFKEIFG